MQENKSSKKIKKHKSVSIRFPLAVLRDLRRAAPLDRRSINAFVVYASTEAATAVFRREAARTADTGK